MLGKKQQIKVNVELFGGLYVKISNEEYSFESGIELNLADKSTPKDILKALDLPFFKSMIFFVNEERASANARLKNGDKIICLTAASGG